MSEANNGTTEKQTKNKGVSANFGGEADGSHVQDARSVDYHGCQAGIKIPGRTGPSWARDRLDPS